MVSFNLVDKPWIPVLDAKEEVKELSLREALLKAPQIREITDASPLVTAALHRLLLAVLHRALDGPRDVQAWAQLWKAGTFNGTPIPSYLDRWHSRFDLFDAQWPFYQTAALSYEYQAPVSRLVHGLASGNNATLFDHSTDGGGVDLGPAQAARFLVAHQAFAVGGLVSLEHGDDPHTDKSARGAPLTKGAMALIKGGNLFQTLLLNLVRYDPAQDEPFPATRGDVPAWERGTVLKGDRVAAGYVDLLTWQSRRIRLHPEVNPDGMAVVRQVVIMKGSQLPANETLQSKDTMLAFARNLRAKEGQDPWPVIGFQEDRALWRDSLSMLQSVADTHSRPKTFDWLHELVEREAIDPIDVLPVDYLGLCSARAKLILWRHERLPLPLRYLNDAPLVGKLEDALGAVERVGELLHGRFFTPRNGKPRPTPFQILGQELVALVGGKDAQESVDRVVESLAPGRAYWSRLEGPFKRLMVDLAHADDPHAELDRWDHVVRQAALESFDEATQGLERSARTLKALAMGERAFRSGLATLLPALQPTHTGGSK